MSFEATRREALIARAVSLILDDVPVPVDLLADLDQEGVNINWLFKEAASTLPTNNEDEGVLYE